MKTILKSGLILSFFVIGWLQSEAQDAKTVQEVCIGSGVHCATLEYGAIKMTFVKSPKAPGIKITEQIAGK